MGGEKNRPENEKKPDAPSVSGGKPAAKPGTDTKRSDEKRKKKKKQEKTTYIDDGRSLANMSGFGVRGSLSGGSRGTLKDQARTFFAAMKMMVVPMLVTMGIIAVAFLAMYLLLMLSL